MSSLPAHLQAGVKAQGDLSVGVSQFLIVTGSRHSGENNTNFPIQLIQQEQKNETLSLSAGFKIGNC
jgi:hypothetical protein